MKPRIVSAIIAALALAAPLAAPLPASLSAEDAASFQLSGTVDPSASYARANRESIYAAFQGAADTSASGEIDGKLTFSRDYHGLGLLDFALKDSALLDHSSGATLESISLTVNEFYGDLNFGDLAYLRLGKQRLSWGSGYVFNPSDPVNPPKDPTNQRAILEGVPALKAELIEKPVSLMAFAVLYDEFAELGYGAKLSTSALPQSDISLSGYWSPSQSWTGALNAAVAPLYAFPGWDTLQVWGEGSVYGKGRYGALDADASVPGADLVEESEGVQWAVLCGASGTLPELRTVVLAECYYLSEGLSAAGLESVYKALHSADPAVVGASRDWYGELERRPGRQAKDYLFVSVDQSSVTDSGDPVLDKIGLSASCLVNLADWSTYASAELSTAFVKDSSVDLTASWARGESYTEFGNAPADFELAFEVKVFF